MTAFQPLVPFGTSLMDEVLSGFGDSMMLSDHRGKTMSVLMINNVLCSLIVMFLQGLQSILSHVLYLGLRKT